MIWLPICISMPVALMPVKTCSAGIDCLGALEGNAELVFLLAGRNLGMGSGINIRVDAEGDMRDLASLDGAGIQKFQFRLGFDVEAVDASLKRQIHFARGFANA